MILTLTVPNDATKIFEIVIIGKPVARARAKFFRRGKGIWHYDPQKDEVEHFRLLAKEQVAGRPMIKGAVFLNALFLMPRPKNHYGTGRNEGVLKPSAPELHIVKPDSDNLLKFAKDGLNKIAWYDDSQVVGSFPWKEYAERAGTILKIYELRGNERHKV